MTAKDEDSRPRDRSGKKINWAVLLGVMSITWALMAYLIYRVIASARW